LIAADINFFSGPFRPIDIINKSNMKLKMSQTSIMTNHIVHDLYEKIEKEISDYIFDDIFWWNEYQ
jgi:hypothetical protein